jgi:putative peptidoglycan lipid II flippase
MTKIQPKIDNAEKSVPLQNLSHTDGLLKSSGIAGSMTMLSRVLGLVRDIVIARIFGTTDASDAFFLANKIPNFMRRLFAEGAFNQAFVPVLAEYRSQRTHGEVLRLINAVSASLGGFLLLLVVGVVGVAPWVGVPIAYGFTDQPEKFALFVEMLRITFPYSLLISLAALCSAILNAYGKFAVSAFTPALLNVSLISSSFFLAPYMREPELALAWGVLIAGFAQLLFQLPFLHQINLLPRPRRDRMNEGVRRIKKLMLPALFGVSVTQINLLFDAFIASLLVTGSVTWLYFSDRLMELPLGTFGIAIAIVVLPNLSRHHAESSMEEFRKTLDWSFRLICLIAFPSTIGLIIIAEPLLITLFQNENFTTSDIIASAGSLRAYAIGLVAFMAIKIFSSGYFARQDTKTPVRIGIIAMAANMIMNLVFYLNGFAHVGLALATSIAAFINAGLLIFGLYREKVFQFQDGWIWFCIQVFAANLVLFYFLIRFAGDWQTWQLLTSGSQVIKLGVLVFGGVFLYFGTLFCSGLRMRHIYR